MGKGEEEKSSKPENSSSPSKDPNNVHVYPSDWATMQAYYGPRLAVPPYLNSAIASPHAPPPPPYMWGPPQAMISPYGTPYAAFYAHGGIYTHPGIPLGGTTLGMETQVKSPGNADGGFVKKLKEFDGLAMSIGNGNGTDRRLSQSEETEGSSDGSIGVTEGAVNTSKKRSRQGSRTADGNAQRKDVLTIPALEVSRTPEKLKDVISTATVPVKTTENINADLILKDPSNSKPSSTNFVPQTSTPKDIWLQSERELRRERRKQSNRESARRSRLKKQALSEDLAGKVQILSAENMSLKSEMNILKERSEKLRVENDTLMVNLKRMRMKKPFGTVNLLARVNNSDSDSSERNENGTKLRQLLDGSPCRTVAAG
ncbi:hypothetical protein ACJIZ3_016057 [Penstemon smallii]|uniref:BZIP domain-containing protein n=1 Tax=Penstemon smallii TaxID=265156 RepID=A0ABD3RP99_9LAMI